jgi:hypothetical protein
MNRSALVAAAICAAATLASQAARADENEFETEGTVAQAGEPSPGTSPGIRSPYAPTTAGIVTKEYSLPNAGLVTSGAFLFGTAYGTSLIVAATSDRAEDKRLYVPVAGPWMDLTKRERCSAGRLQCENETTYKVLLVANGLLQGIGALEMLSGFAFRTKYTEVLRQPVAKGIHVTPTATFGGAGISAYGAF